MRVFLVALLLFAAVIFPPLRASAYGTDVHFNLTYVAARLTGFGYRDALWLAFSDESIDQNRSTSAYNGTIDTMLQFVGLHRYTWARNGERWQAYTDAGTPNSTLNGILTTTRYTNAAAARTAIAARRDRLWENALTLEAHILPADRSSVIRAEIALGVYLHYLQDMYAHRQFGQDLDGENWQPFGTFRGHSAEGYSPDYVALRPQLAREMLHATLVALHTWQQRRGSKPSDIPPSLEAALITNDARAYDVRALAYPDHRFRPWFPAQRMLNHELRLALDGANVGHDWSPILPNANELKFQLPYDMPTTPLRVVEQRLGEPQLSNDDTPFASVLPREIANP